MPNWKELENKENLFLILKKTLFFLCDWMCYINCLFDKFKILKINCFLSVLMANTNPNTSIPVKTWRSGRLPWHVPHFSRFQQPRNVGGINKPARYHYWQVKCQQLRLLPHNLDANANNFTINHTAESYLLNIYMPFPW